MKHLGDITKLNGAEIPFVDIITGGSPCQDLSIAGKRKGLAGERSGLFMDQMRLIKEQRNETKRLFDKGAIDSIRPRFMVWENVPGAFSSNKGEDFRCVLEETAKVVERDARIPGPPNGKWPHSGCIMGNGWSIAWRLHDAQFWGVPQRRKRIALVADFAGGGAPEILFERESLPRNTEQSETEREEVTGTIGTGIDKAITFQERGGRPGGGKGILIQNDRTGALSTVNNQMVFDASRRHDYQQFEDVCETVQAHYGTGGGNVPIVRESCTNETISMEVFHCTSEEEKVQTLKARDFKDPQVVYTIGHDERSAKFTTDEITDPLTSSDYKDPIKVSVPENNSIVRRLTPLECERLQGYPDGWTDIGEWVDSKGKKRKDSDSPRYKALGNSIALPFWQWMAHKMVKYIDGHQPTMASLFSGIGGFELVFSRAGCEPVWCSEIEEFPIAVTKYHFPDNE